MSKRGGWKLTAVTRARQSAAMKRRYEDPAERRKTAIATTRGKARAKLLRELAAKREAA